MGRPYDLNVLLGVLLVAAAAGLLWLGAELFVEHVTAAGRLGLTGLAAGLLIAIYVVYVAVLYR